jgi:diadenosine tetraphosphate (Ap4A) HIT family hydrolase
MTPAERLLELAEGRNPRMILKMRSGFAVMADNQFLPGYCLLLAYPQVSQLNDLDTYGRMTFLEDMATLGDAIDRVTECKRCNYAMYGNVDPFLHAHVWPRYDWEIDEYATIPPLAYPEEIRTHGDTEFDPLLHGESQDQIRRTLLKLLEERGHTDSLH